MQEQDQPNISKQEFTGEQVQMTYAQVETSLQNARENPYGKGLIKSHVRRLTRRLAPEHKQNLLDGFVKVLPLTLLPEVQQGKAGEMNPIELSQEILTFLSGFRNTDVSKIPSRRPQGFSR